MKRLHDAHRWSAGPIKTTRSNGLELYLLVAEHDGPQTSVCQNGHLRRNSGRETQVICGGKAVDNNACLIASCDGIDHRFLAGLGRLLCERVVSTSEVQSSVDS